MAIYMGGGTLLAKTEYGLKIYLDSNDISLTPHIALEGRWESWISNLFQSKIIPGNTVLDIGSNCGFYTLLASKQVGNQGRVIAFDANPRMVELLNKSIPVNGFLNITKAHNYAVSDKSDKLNFKILRKFQGSSSFDLDSDYIVSVGDAYDQIEVQAIVLDDFLQDAKVDVIKIDIEGAEFSALKGANNLLKKNKNIKIFMEWPASSNGVKQEDKRRFLQYMGDMGFKFYDIMNDSSLVRAEIESLINESGWRELYIERDNIHSENNFSPDSPSYSIKLENKESYIFRALDLKVKHDGFVKGDRIRFSRQMSESLGLGRESVVSYGPYVKMEKGRYKFFIDIDIPKKQLKNLFVEFRSEFGVISNVSGKKLIRYIWLIKTKRGFLFDIAQNLDKFEVVIYYTGKKEIRLSKYLLTRVG